MALVVSGHDHEYERTLPVPETSPMDPCIRRVDGVARVFGGCSRPIHLRVGTGGVTSDQWLSPDPPAWSAYRERSFGQCVSVCPVLSTLPAAQATQG